LNFPAWLGSRVLRLSEGRWSGNDRFPSPLDGKPGSFNVHQTDCTATQTKKRREKHKATLSKDLLRIPKDNQRLPRLLTIAKERLSFPCDVEASPSLDLGQNVHVLGLHLGSL